MKLVEMKCKNCGATLKVESDQIDIACNYCHAKYKLDDEVQHIKYDDMEQAGYEFEKGKIRAQQEAKNNYYQNINRQNSVNHKKSNTWLWVLGWIFFFPAPLTILIWRSNWEKKTKIIVTVILWLFLLLFAYATPDETESQATNNDKKIQEVNPSDIDVANKFITLFNHDSTYKISNLIKYNAQDKDSGHYRTEFRLNAWNNNIAYNGKINNANIYIIQYGNNLSDLRIYCEYDDINIKNEVVKMTLTIFDINISDEEINKIISSSSRENILLGENNSISGYVDNSELMLDTSKIKFLN